MDFKSSDSPASIDYTSSYNISVTNGTIVGNGFSSNQLASSGPNYNLSGNIQGSFYGSSAETTKGTFSTSDIGKTTSGTFTATR